MEQNERSVEATLKFYLPENQDEFEIAVNGYKWRMAMWDLDQWLRSQMKYRDDFKENEYETLEKCREILYEKLSDYSLNLD